MSGFGAAARGLQGAATGWGVYLVQSGSRGWGGTEIIKWTFSIQHSYQQLAELSRLSGRHWTKLPQGVTESPVGTGYMLCVLPEQWPKLWMGHMFGEVIKSLYGICLGVFWLMK